MVENEAIALSSIAKQNQIHSSTFQRNYKEHLSDFREWEQGLVTDTLVYPANFGPRMSIDETSLQNGELYTILTNKDAKGKKGALVALIKGTKASVVNEALSVVPIATKMGVKEVTLDLANSMDWICRTNFQNAVLTADRFHFQKVVTEGVQEIRIKLRREAIDEDNAKNEEARKNKQKYKAPVYSNGDTKKQLLARGRYVLFKPKGKWTATQAERAKILFDNFPELKKAYNLSMDFRNIFERSKTRKEGEKRLKAWYEKVNSSSVGELISAANTIKNHEGKILNYFYHRETNASAESFNAKLKGFRALLRGIRDMNFFLFRVEKLFA